MDTGLTLTLKPSRQLLLMYVLLGTIGMGGIYALPFLEWQQWLLIFFVLGILVCVVQKHALLTLQSSIVALSYQPQLAQGQRWQVKTKAGKMQAVELVLQHCFVSPTLTVLNVQATPKPLGIRRLFANQSILIMPDRLAHADYRSLRVLLSWSHQQDETTPI